MWYQWRGNAVTPKHVGAPSRATEGHSLILWCDGRKTFQGRVCTKASTKDKGVCLPILQNTAVMHNMKGNRITICNNFYGWNTEPRKKTYQGARQSPTFGIKPLVSGTEAKFT